MARSPAEHYDRIKSVLTKLHTAYPDSPLVTDLHAVLGDAWDDFRAEYTDDDPDLAARSGGTDKPPVDDPDEPVDPLP